MGSSGLTGQKDEVIGHEYNVYAGPEFCVVIAYVTLPSTDQAGATVH